MTDTIEQAWMKYVRHIHSDVSEPVKQVIFRTIGDEFDAGFRAGAEWQAHQMKADLYKLKYETIPYLEGQLEVAKEYAHKKTQ